MERRFELWLDKIPNQKNCFSFDIDMPDHRESQEFCGAGAKKAAREEQLVACP
jgi:hypothetical protein